VSTVEQHLTRVYRKLDIRRRADLPPELSRSYDEESSMAHPGEQELKSA
jgi:hypothetical protein